jgi:polyphosphate kinase
MIFGAGENAEVLMGSADLMTRNLYHRIEVCVSIKTPACKKELLDYFDIQWNDNDSAVVLTSNLEQKKPDIGAEKINAQDTIYHYLKNKT